MGDADFGFVTAEAGSSFGATRTDDWGSSAGGASIGRGAAGPEIAAMFLAAIVSPAKYASEEQIATVITPTNSQLAICDRPSTIS